MSKPNILLIMADQLSVFMMGPYGNKQVKTPNLDRLANLSVTFDGAYTPEPLCTPARASLMTGKYCYELGCWDNATPFSSAEPTFAHYLTLLGYETVLSGKMHFIGPDQLHGFHKRLTSDMYPSGFKWLPKFIDKENHIMQYPFGHAKNYTAASYGTKEWNQGLQHDEETQYRAVEYLYDKGRKNEEQSPFCLCVSYHHPHDHFNPPKKYWDMYKDAQLDIPDLSDPSVFSRTQADQWLNKGYHRTDLYDIKSPENLLNLRRNYAALVTYIDDKVGELLKVLDDTGLADNTAIIFTSDHGDMLAEREMVQKRCFYEWSARVPLLLKLPNGSFAGKRNHELVSLLDIGSTMRAIAGETGEEKTPPNDGVNLLDVLKGGYEDRTIYSESHGEGLLWPTFMVRYRQYKYIYVYEYEDTSGLYDLEADPQELHNLYGLPEYKAVAEMMRAKLLERFSPERVQKELVEKTPERAVIRDAMELSGETWDYTPNFPGSDRYVR